MNILYIALSFFLFVVAIMSLFIPFWVLRIRNETITMNHRIGQIVRLMDGDAEEVVFNKVQSTASLTCSECGESNQPGAYRCEECGNTSLQRA